MKRILYFITITMFVSACGTSRNAATRASQYAPIYANVEAKDLLYTSISRPLIEAGYYVISPMLSLDILKAESAYDSEIFFDRNLEPFNRYLGADAVVFSVIDSWTKKGFGIETKIRYVIKSAYTNEIMFDRSCDLYLDLSINSGSGGIFGAVVDLAASAITTAATDHIVAARKANYFILSDMPRGKYSPEYMQDQDVKAMQKEISAVVK